MLLQAAAAQQQSELWYQPAGAVVMPVVPESVLHLLLLAGAPAHAQLDPGMHNRDNVQQFGL